MKSVGVWYWYVKIPQYRYMEHGLEYITFYVMAVCSGSPVGSWQAARSAFICETCLLKRSCIAKYIQTNVLMKKSTDDTQF